MDPIVFESQLSADDYLEASRFIQQQLPDKHRAWRMVNLIGAGAGFAFLFASDRTSWPAPALLIVLGLINLLNTLLRPTAQWRLKWVEYAEKWGHRQFEFSEAILRIQRSQSCTDYSWYAFSRFAESRNLFLLYVSDTTCEIIPKRECPDPHQVRALLKQKTTRVEGAFPVDSK